MKQEKTYEEKIADIKEYLREKEVEMENNRRREIRKNPLEDEDINLNTNNKNIKIEKEYVEKKSSRQESRISKSLNFDDDEDIKTNQREKINEMSKKEEESIDKGSKCALKTISNVCLFLLPIFIFFAVISLHTTYFVRKPINYATMIMSAILLIVTIVLKIKVIKNSKFKTSLLKNIVTILLVTIFDIIFTFLVIKKQMWNLLDKIIENRLLIILLFLLLIVIFIIIKLVRKLKQKKMKIGTKNILYTGIATLYILCYIDGLSVLYGPSDTFKEWLITTAMQTMNHQYLCKWFYSGKQIDYIMSQNYVIESGESTNPDLIDLEKEKVVYENEYEEAVLKKDHKDDPYKIINFEVNGCKAYLAVIYDPTTIKVATTSKLGVAGQYVTTMAENNNAILAINGGGFYDPGNSSAGGTPTGITIVDGKIVTNGEYGTNVQGGGIIGFDDKGVFYLLKNKTAQQAIDMGITNAVSWGPFLIVNGEPSFIKGNGGWGYAARTAIGQREDGIVLLLVVDSNATRTNGADMVDLTEIMQNYGAINAANLDGGTSSVMVLPKKEALSYRSDCKDNYCYINDPIDGGLYHSTRAIADAFIVVKK